MTKTVTVSNSSNEKTTISVTSSEPVCCPPKDQDHWNQHPRVYLSLEKNGEANCPYCGNHFVFKAE